MVLLLVDTLVKNDQAAVDPMLLLATAFPGAGFGLTVPAREHLFFQLPPC